MKCIIIGMMLVSIAAFGQEPARRDTIPTQQKPFSVPDTMTVVVKMNILDYQKIIGALSYMPFRDVSELILRIEQQLKSQIEARVKQTSGRNK